jgi:hypothetical protein
MPKRELIEALADLPDDAEIYLNTVDCEFCDLLTAKIVPDDVGLCAVLSDLTPRPDQP